MCKPCRCLLVVINVHVADMRVSFSKGGYMEMVCE